MTTKKILITPGDGIGPEVTEQAVQILKQVASLFDIKLDLTEKPVGGLHVVITLSDSRCSRSEVTLICNNYYRTHFRIERCICITL